MKFCSSVLIGLCLFGLTSVVHAEAEAVFVFSGGEADIDKNGIGGTDTALKIGSGFKVTDTSGIEIYWAKYGKPEKTVNISGLGNTDVTTEIFSLAFEYVRYIPVADSFDLLGRFGLAFWKSEVGITGAGTFSDNGIDLSVGVGASVDISQDWSFRVEWEYSQLRNFDVSFLSAGFAHYFE